MGALTSIAVAVLTATAPRFEAPGTEAVIVRFVSPHGLPQHHRGELLEALKRRNKASLQWLSDWAASGNAVVEPLPVIDGARVVASREAIARLAWLPGIESVRPDLLLELPDEPLADGAGSDWNLAAIGAPALWSRGMRGDGAVVAVLDTGVDFAHPDLRDRRRATASWFDPYGERSEPVDLHGHGTQVAGLVAGGDISGRILGVAPQAHLIAARIYGDSGAARLSAVHAAFGWLLDPDGDPTTDDAPQIAVAAWGAGLDRCDEEFRQDLEMLKAAGILVVMAAGNSGPSRSTSVSPANLPGSLSVGATGSDGLVAAFSARGPSACGGWLYPSVVAPGVEVASTDLTYGGLFPESWVSVTGSSFAAAHVAGAAALLLSARDGLTPLEVEAALRESARDLAPPGPDHDSGHGLIDLESALELLSCRDLDGDGYGVGQGCSGPVDCNDFIPWIHPGAFEFEHDGIDADCNGPDLVPGAVRTFVRPSLPPGDRLGVSRRLSHPR